jgi:hypothetical protein
MFSIKVSVLYTIEGEKCWHPEYLEKTEGQKPPRHSPLEGSQEAFVRGGRFSQGTADSHWFSQHGADFSKGEGAWMTSRTLTRCGFRSTRYSERCQTDVLYIVSRLS